MRPRQQLTPKLDISSHELTNNEVKTIKGYVNRQGDATLIIIVDDGKHKEEYILRCNESRFIECTCEKCNVRKDARDMSPEDGMYCQDCMDKIIEKSNKVSSSK